MVICNVIFKEYNLKLMCQSRDRYSSNNVLYKPNAGYVYIIVCNGLIKIGSSQKPNSRILSQVYKHKNLYKLGNSGITYKIHKIFISELIEDYTYIECRLCQTLKEYKHNDSCKEIFKISFTKFIELVSTKSLDKIGPTELNDIDLLQLNIMKKLEEFLNTDIIVKNDIAGIYMYRDKTGDIKSNWLYNRS